MSPFVRTVFLPAARRGVRRASWVIGPALLWVLLGRTGVVSLDIYSAGSLVVSLVLFAFSIPCSILIRLDNLFVDNPNLDPSLAIVAAAGCVIVNFVLICVIREALRRRGGKSAARTVGGETSDQSGPPVPNRNGTRP